MIEEYGAAAVWPKAFDETAAARCKRGTAPPRNDGGGGRKKAAKPAGAQERTEPKYGRGEHPNSRKNMDKGRAKKMQEQTEAERLSTVPLPADRNEINVACTRDFLVDPPHVTPHQPSPRRRSLRCTRCISFRPSLCISHRLTTDCRPRYVRMWALGHRSRGLCRTGPHRTRPRLTAPPQTAPLGSRLMDHATLDRAPQTVPPRIALHGPCCMDRAALDCAA